ncbi:glucose-repressible protein [Penicillium herquei]|nr:glucose-repressible protein [Penicillium herquei]
METAKNAANYLSESIKGSGHETSKEANKKVAKDSDAGLGTRVSAAKDALKDKGQEEKHDAKADAYKGNQ